MALQYQSLSHGDLGGSGIDALSSEDAIQDGYAEDLLNVDASPQGYLSKRVGYQQMYGQLPVRVLGMEYLDTETIQFTLDASIDLSNIQGPVHSRPIVVSGKNSNQNTTGTGDFSTAAVTTQYYPRFDADVRRTFPLGTNTVEIPATEHGLDSPFMFIGTALSSNNVTRSNSVFMPNLVQINEVSFDISVQEINGASPEKQYVYWADKTPRPGFVYVSPVPTVDNVLPGFATNITAATHGLTSKNIQVYCYRVDLGTYTQIIPNEVSISNNGDVSITFTNVTPMKVFFILSVVDADKVLTSNQYNPTTGTVTVQIQNPPTPYIFASCYKDYFGISKVQVYPDSIVYNDDTDTVTLTFYTPNAQILSVYWEPGYIISNRLRVSANTATSLPFEDTRPQMTLWGLDHSQIYLNPEESRAGWVTHLDTYRSAGNNFLVAGLGGNLFSGKDLDAGTKVQYKIPSLYPSLRARTSAEVTCGPAFQASSSGGSPVLTTPRTGGAVGGSLWGSGFAYSSSLEYVKTGAGSTQGYVKVVLRDPEVKQIQPTSGTWNAIVPNQDWLNIENAGNPIHNGLWKIVGSTIYQAGFSSDPRVELTVQNLNIKTITDDNSDLVGSSIWDSTTGAKCGIFSGRIPLAVAADKVPFVPGDTILSTNLTAAEPIQVAGVSGTQLNLLNFYQLETFPSSTTIVGRRVSDVISIRNASDEESVDGFAGTDNVQIDGYLRQFKVKSINPLPTVDILSIIPTIVLINDIPTPVATVELSVRMGPALECTLNPATDTFTFSAYPNLAVDTPVTLAGTTLPPEASPNSIYYVKSASTATPWPMQLSATPGGPALDFSTAGSDLTIARAESKPAYVFAAGDRVTLGSCGQYTGTVTISNVVDETHFQFETDQTGNLTYNLSTQPMHLIGKTICIDEEIQWEDSLSSSIQVQVPGRWLPIEAPEHSSDLAPTTYKRYLDNSAYDEQPILRSTQVADTLFLNNGDDRTLKIDGQSLYRPGLIRWQPQLFFSQATAVGFRSIPLIRTEIPLVSNKTWVNNHFYVSEFDVLAFTVGTKIDLTLNGVVLGSYTIVNTTSTSNGSDHLIYVDKNILPGQFQNNQPYRLSSVSTYSYYFRLNAVDANQNVVASAATGSYDCTIQVTSDFQNRIRMVGLPTLDTYDYDRLEVQVYRTKQNGVAPYYLLTTLSIPFNKNQGYIDWVDTVADSFLGSVSQLDPVNTALKGQELGVGWSAPVRAKHLTSAANRLVLGNLTSDPYIDLVLRNLGSTVSSSDLNGKTLLLRKSNLDNSTDTNMLDRIKYEFITGTNAGGVDTSGNIHPISSFSYVGDTVTLTFAAAHGREVGDWVYLYRDTADANLNTHLMGWWQVSQKDTLTLSFKWLPSDGVPDVTLFSQVNKMCHATVGKNVPVFLGTDLNWQTSNGQPVAGGVGIQNLAMRRLASAINVTQRMVNPTVTPGFSPWIVANAGGEFAEGQLLLTQPMNQTTVFELVLFSSFSNFSIFANGVERSPSEQVQAREDLHPSRILISYPNFPEIFDSPFATVDSQSDSAVDINPADGQEITAVMPFFGSSAFGAALKDAVVVVFKTNSIYVVNLAAKAAGQNAVQKIESQGLGCTASNSVATVRDGIMFANDSGIYKLRTDLSIYYMGRYMQRQWRNRVNKKNLDLVFGHNWSFGSQYKLSLPTDSSSIPDETFVYNSTREYSLEGPNTQAHREGSWVRHRGFSSIGWCNLDADSFQANTRGQVLILRRTGEASDWRDDSEAIDMDIVLRAMDFGDEGIRKTVPYALISYRNPLDQGVRTGTQVLYTTDLYDAFYSADPTVIPNRAEAQGLSDEWSQKVVTFRYSFNNKRGIRFQLRIQNSLKDESVEVARVRYSVAGLSIKGVMQAAQSPAYLNT